MITKCFQLVIPLVLLVSGCAEAQTSDTGNSSQMDVVQQPDESTSDTLSIANSPEYAPIFDRLTVLIKQEVPAEEQFKYLGTEERKGYLQQIRENHTPRRSKFKIILGLNNGEGEGLIKTLPKEFTDIHDTIDNLRSRADNEYVCSLPSMECDKE